VINEFPYVDIMRDPPEHIQSFKFDEKLEIENVNTANGLDFYSEILRAAIKMQDAHYTFATPFLTYFAYMLPYCIDSIPSDSGMNRRFKFVSSQADFNSLFYGGCLLYN
jgi:hypothetical protein